MSGTTKEHLDTAFKLKRAIVAISDRLPSHAKCVVDQFLRHVSPSFVRAYGVDFPHTCRQHNRNPERCRDGSGKYPLLYFHVGNAILAYYDSVQGKQSLVANRIILLEEIAIRGLDAFAVIGNDVDGYLLGTVDEARKIREAENQREFDRFAENNANAVPAETTK